MFVRSINRRWLLGVRQLFDDIIISCFLQRQNSLGKCGKVLTLHRFQLRGIRGRHAVSANVSGWRRKYGIGSLLLWCKGFRNQAACGMKIVCFHNCSHKCWYLVSFYIGVLIYDLLRTHFRNIWRLAVVKPCHQSPTVRSEIRFSKQQAFSDDDHARNHVVRCVSRSTRPNSNPANDIG